MHYGITQSQIDAQNRINGLANEVEGHLIRLLSAWQQRKACKTSGYGGKVAALEKAFSAYCESHGYNVPASDGKEAGVVWVNLYRSHTSIVASVQLILNSSPRVEIYLGRTDDQGVITHLGECEKRRTDFTVTEVESTLATAYRLEEEARTLRANVRDFLRR